MAVIPSPGLILPISDRVDLVQGNPPLSPTGIARIAMIAGVPSVSINGGAYASFGSAGSAPSGTVQPQVRYLPTDHLDFIMGDPPVSPKGCGRLAVTTAGVASVSIESAAYASLGVSGAASTGCQLFPGFLYSTDYVDIVQGNPAVSLPGTARIACAPGSSTLSISINGAAYTTIAANQPPGSPALWYDAQNVDGLNNSSMVDGQQVGTWVNLGSLGASGTLTQATASSRPIFRLVGAAGKINNKSAVEGVTVNTTFMQTSSFTAQGTVYYIAAVVKAKSNPGVAMLAGETGDLFQWGLISGNQRLFQGGSSPTTGQTLTVGNWQSIGAQYNTASSFSTMDSVQSANVNVTVVSGILGQFIIFNNGGINSSFDGFIVEMLAYVGTPAIAPINAYFVAKYGVTPQ
jgi:hypothetical protein